MTQFSNVGAIPNGPGITIRQGLNSADIAILTENAGADAPALTYPYMKWRDEVNSMLYRRNASNTAWQVIERYSMTRDPGPTDDSNTNHIIGTVWTNISNKSIWDCMDASSGSAVWNNRSVKTLSVVDGGDASTLSFTSTIDCGNASG